MDRGIPQRSEDMPRKPLIDRAGGSVRLEGCSGQPGPASPGGAATRQAQRAGLQGRPENSDLATPVRQARGGQATRRRGGRSRPQEGQAERADRRSETLGVKPEGARPGIDRARCAARRTCPKGNGSIITTSAHGNTARPSLGIDAHTLPKQAGELHPGCRTGRTKRPE